MHDLERSYTRLAEEADTARLKTPPELRLNADRRTKRRLAVACAGTAIVLIAGMVAAASATHRTRNGDTTHVGEDATASGVPSRSASAAPSATAGTSSPLPAPPTSIPDRAFLQKADTLDVEAPRRSTEPILPPLCAASYGSDALIRVRATRYTLYWYPSHRTGYTPDGSFLETITGYRGDGAIQFLDQVRTAVRACPTESLHGIAYRYRLLSGPPRGDESILFEVTSPTRDVLGRPTGTTEVRLITVVRLGSVVMVLFETGYEAGWTADRQTFDVFSERAMKRITAWLDG